VGIKRGGPSMLIANLRSGAHARVVHAMIGIASDSG
jgi:hypothetical protein